VETFANCPFLFSSEGVASRRKASPSIRSFLWMQLFPYFKSLKVLMGTNSILCLTWDVHQQTDGTFEDTLVNAHGINDMTNLELFPIG
jgi:hypothetical protein